MSSLRMDTIEELKKTLDEYFDGCAWKDEDIPISKAAGRYLAEDISGTEDLPGFDLTAAQVCYKTGHRLTVRDIGILASMGKFMVSVWAKPYVTVLTTGEEWVSVLDKPGPDQMRDANSFIMSSLLNESGVQIVGMNLIRGKKAAVEEAVRSAVDHSDFVVLTMGTRMGAEAEMSEIIRGMGKPGVIEHAPVLTEGGGVILGAIKDEFCHCAGRMPAFVACLPGKPAEALEAYQVVVDYFIRKYYFRNL